MTDFKAHFNAGLSQGEIIRGNSFRDALMKSRNENLELRMLIDETHETFPFARSGFSQRGRFASPRSTEFLTSKTENGDKHSRTANIPIELITIYSRHFNDDVLALAFPCSSNKY